MSSSDKKGFTGTAIVLLGLFGVGGAVLDRMRNGDDTTEKAPVASVQKEIVTGAMSSARSGAISKAPAVVGMSEQAKQKPDFEAIKLAKDGTGRVVGKAAPGAKIVVEIDGKSEKMVEVDANGDFLVDLNKPLAAGTHILVLKSIGPVGREPVGSDRSIKIDIAKGRDISVFVLEKGQDPLILQGSHSNADSEVLADADVTTPPQKTVAQVSAKKLAAAQKAAVAQVSAKKLAAAQKAAAAQASAKKLAAVQKAAAAQIVKGKPGAAKIWRDISFADMGYQDKKGEVNLTGKAQSGAKLRFLLDGKALGSATADKNGVWSLKARQQLEPGAHWLVAEQIDGKGKRIAVAEAPFDRPDKVIQMASNETGGRALEPGKSVVMEGGNPSEKRVAQADMKSGQERGATAGKTVRTPGANGGAEKGSESLWDKFKGIFKVDPNAPDKGKPSGAELAGQKGLAGSKSAKSVSGSKSFAFESLAYREGARGGTVMMTGRSNPGAHIKIFDGPKELGETVADKKGQWAFNKKGKVKQGTHQYRAAHILKTGREGSVAHMQYDHVKGMKVAQVSVPKAVKSVVPAAKDRNATKQGSVVKRRVKKAPALESKVRAGTKKTDVRSVQATKPVKARKSRKARRLARKLRRARRARAARKYALSKRSSRRQRAKRKYYSTGRRVKTRLRTRRARLRLQKARKARKARRSRKVRLASRTRGVRRRYLGGNNKARYWIKKKPYLKSGKLRKKVRVYKGNKFYGYGRVRSRNGKVVVLINKKK